MRTERRKKFDKAMVIRGPCWAIWVLAPIWSESIRTCGWPMPTTYRLERFTRKHTIKIAVGEGTVNSCLGDYYFQMVDSSTPRCRTREMTVFSLCA